MTESSTSILPVEWNSKYSKVTGKFLSIVADGADADLYPDGAPITGSISFMPAVKNLLDVASNTAYLPRKSFDVDINPDGTIEVWLIPTDDKSLLPVNWNYRVTYNLSSGQIDSHTLDVPSGTTVQLIPAMPQVDSKTGDYIYQSPNSKITGTGVPEGRVTASVGVTYVDSAATNGVIEYIKESGTGNTGWKQTYPALSHAASHATGGADPITPQSIGASGSMGAIAAGTNLNNLKAPGTYVQSIGSNATTAFNYPAPGLAGYLVVSAPGHTAYLQQTYFPLRSASGAVWQRTMYGPDAWDAWTMVSPFRGAGFPEGIVAAPVGSEYIDTSSTNGARRWYKSGGTGNTGWIVAEGDTGWRDVSALLDTSVALTAAHHHAWMRRVGDMVDVIYVVSIPAASPLIGKARTVSVNIFPALPPGWTPRKPYGIVGACATVNFPGVAGTTISSNILTHVTTVATGQYTQGDWLSGTCRYAVNASWPTALPGAAV